MDIQRDPEVSRISWKKSSRVGASQSAILIPMAWSMRFDPRSVLVLRPTEPQAESFSKTKLQPMLLGVPALEGLVEDKSRDSYSTILEKHCTNGAVLHLGGANSSRVFRDLTVSRVYADETSDYPASAGGQGDPIKLGQRRMGDAWDPLLVEVSTPHLVGACRISDSFEMSDQRKFLVPCPHCDHGQFLEWGGREMDFGIKWEGRDPETAYYLCEHCHCPIEHRQKNMMVEQGYYVATNEDGAWPGFFVWAAYSPLPDAAWPRLVEEFYEAGTDPLKLQVFENTVKGLAWENKGSSPRDHDLEQCMETFPMRRTGRVGSDGEPEREVVVPEGVGVLTSHTDVQGNRLETQVCGWGIGEECWVLEYSVLYGDPTGKAVWEALWEFLCRPRWLERGGVDYLRSNAVDSNYLAQEVYRFVEKHLVYETPDTGLAYCWATRGRDGPGLLWPRQAGKGTDTTAPVWTLHVDSGKDVLYGRLKAMTLPEGDEHKLNPGPGYIHIPEWMEDTYLRQLTAEQQVIVSKRGGYPKQIYELKPGRKRNEALDTWVGAYAALQALYSRGLDIEDEVARTARFFPPGPTDDDPAPMAGPQPKPPPDRRPRRQWVQSRRDWMRGR